MANVNTKAYVLHRDRFTCRFCGTRLFLSQAIKVLDWKETGLGLWDLHGKKEPLRSRWATVDHIVSEAEGGLDTLENLAACCVTCNSRKGGTTAQPSIVASETGAWDGLSGLFLGLAEEFAARLSSEDQKWRKALTREGVVPVTTGLEAVLAALRRAKEEGIRAFDDTPIRLQFRRKRRKDKDEE